MGRSGRTAIALLIGVVLLLLLIMVDAGPMIRLPLLIIIVLSAPGWAVIGFRPPVQASAEWTFAVSISIAISIIVSMALILLDWWHPVLAMVGLLGLTGAFLVRHVMHHAGAALAARARIMINHVGAPHHEA